MKIKFYLRDDFTSLAYIGQRVAKELAVKNEVILQKISTPLIAENSDIGIIWGLSQDLSYLKRHKIRYAGLVCEKELTEKEIKFIQKAELQEIWVPSKFCEKHFKNAGFQNVKIVPHGIDNVPLSSCSEDNILMIYTSYNGLSWTTLRKNPFLAINAAQKINKKILLRTEKQRYYNKYNLDKVEFIPYQENLDGVYNRCSCILCPSDSEGFGLIGLEALARGIPLISTKTGNDYLEEMSYVNIDLPVTEEKIYLSLEKLYKNWNEYRKKSIEQREIIFKKYNWENICQKLLMK
jgi:glycosyltransferase involved in cell wall biosynthesis